METTHNENSRKLQSVPPAIDNVPIRRVLVSVFDKTGIDQLAVGLKAAGVRVASTGGTAAALAAHGLEVEDVSQITGFPEVLDGRVKTLHPNIFAGILAREDHPDDLDILSQHGIERFDAVIVNLYDFESVIKRPECKHSEAIELIDIGGPSLVRAAAKNHAFTAVVTDPSQYGDFLESIRSGGISLASRRLLAAEAFRHTAQYDSMIANWMTRYVAQYASGTSTEEEKSSKPALPTELILNLDQRSPLRYGENPHQDAALYAPAGTHSGVAGLHQLCGKELSYNNLLDLDAAVRLVSLIREPAAVVIKHTNPCGAASGVSVKQALSSAMSADPTSAFGSIVAVNNVFDESAAEVLLAPGLFVEVIAAPSFDASAVQLLTTRPSWKASVRLVEMPSGDPWSVTGGLEFRSVAGGFLAQKIDDQIDTDEEWKVATKQSPPADIMASLKFAFTIVRRLTSNAICVCQGTNLVGAGVGQTSRVDSVRIALEKAGSRAENSVLASDAFFPFPDSIELMRNAGIKAIVQPGGSKRDPEVIAAADEAGIPMVLTSVRHFRH